MSGPCSTAARPPKASTGRRLRSERGFGIVEVLVALTVILFCMMSVAAGSAAVARMSGGSAGTVQRAAAMGDLIGYLSAMPWNDLPAEGDSGCVEVSDPYPHQRCLEIDDVSKWRKRIVAIVVPGDPRVAPDTLVVDRGRPLGGNPLSP